MTLIPIADRATLDAAHARSRAAAGAWTHSAGYAKAAAAFDGALSAETIADRAAALLADDRWPAALLAPLIAGLAQDPWFQPPFRVDRDPLRIGAVLFDHPNVSITASILSADVLARLPPPRSIVVSGRLSVVRYWRAGGAQLRLWETTPADADFSISHAPPCLPVDKLSLVDGQIVRIDGRQRAQMIDRASADVVTITATVRADPAPFMREYAVASGNLLRIAALDDRASRVQMLLALLRHAGRADAQDCFEAGAHDPAFFVRWAAMREWLALDAQAALPRLQAMRQDVNAEVRAAADTMTAIVEERLACPG